MIVLGWLVFDQLPDRWTLAGAAIIVASGLYIIHREHRLRVQATAPRPTPKPRSWQKSFDLPLNDGISRL